MEGSIGSLVRSAVVDLERACTAIDDLRCSPAAHRRQSSFELGEASQAAHRALLTLRAWDWTPGDLAALRAPSEAH